MVPVVPEGGEHSYNGSPGFFSSCSALLSHTPDFFFKWVGPLALSSQVLRLWASPCPVPRVISLLCAATFGSVGNALTKLMDGRKIAGQILFQEGASGDDCAQQ